LRTIRPSDDLAERFADISEAEPKELFCKDFDRGCFAVADPVGCKCGKSSVINHTYFYTLPVEAICPICDPLL
jgi:hypothetical protein